MLFRLAILSLTLCSLSQVTSAAVVISYEFNTDGDTEGWFGNAGQISGLATSGDFLTAADLIGGDPQLANPTDLLLGPGDDVAVDGGSVSSACQ